jgi:hypothetical protein
MRTIEIEIKKELRLGTFLIIHQKQQQLVTLGMALL